MSNQNPSGRNSESANGAGDSRPFGIRPIGHIRTPYTTKFGIPRQPGLVRFEGRIVFEPEFRNPAALRGLEGFDRIWLIWSFSRNLRDSWTATVRPPRLGGSARQGVFATRSPFRPNGLGLSCVELAGIDDAGPKRPVVRVRGMDLADGTPIFDIKPYIPYADAFPEAAAGWTASSSWQPIEEVRIGERELAAVPQRLREGLVDLLKADPRPAYRREGDDGRVYWVPVDRFAVYFRVAGRVCEVRAVRRLDDAELAELRETGRIRDDAGLLKGDSP